MSVFVRALPLVILWSSVLSVACAGEDNIGADEASATESVWTCDGTVGKNRPADGEYYVTSFGCYLDEQGNPQGDVDDNCIPYCMGHHPSRYEKLCGDLSGPECERQIGWYTADAHRLGCLSRVKVTNPENGKAAVLVVLDAGPSCEIEEKVDHWVLDMSYPASEYLFGEAKAATEKGLVQVEPVGGDTPLGPVDTNLPPFVGDSCANQGECGFAVEDGGAGECTMHTPEGGFCTVPCAGYCDESDDKAGTFCASFDGGATGKCMPKPSMFNQWCKGLPGTERRTVERHVGDSGVPASEANVCVPAGW